MSDAKANEKTLIQIAKQIVGMTYDDLTEPEKRITDILIKAGFVNRDGDELSLAK